MIRQVLRDPVDRRDPIGQITGQPMSEELHRQPKQPRQPPVVANYRDPDREPLEESVLEEGQDVHQDAGAEQRHHQSAPGPVRFQDVVDEDTEGDGNHEGQQRQHECAGNRPGEHRP